MLIPENLVRTVHVPQGLTLPGSTERRTSSSRNEKSKRRTCLRFYRWPVFCPRHHFSSRLSSTHTSPDLRNRCGRSRRGSSLRFCRDLPSRDARKENSATGSDNTDEPSEVQTKQWQQEKTSSPHNGTPEDPSIVGKDQSKSAGLRSSYSDHVGSRIPGLAVSTGTIPRHVCCNRVNPHRGSIALLAGSISRGYFETVGHKVRGENGHLRNSGNTGE
jgi:hypothetical protein